MNTTFPRLYRCIVCDRSYLDGWQALCCHRRGWVSKPAEWAVLDSLEVGDYYGRRN